MRWFVERRRRPLWILEPGRRPLVAGQQLDRQSQPAEDASCRTTDRRRRGFSLIGTGGVSQIVGSALGTRGCQNNSTAVRTRLVESSTEVLGRQPVGLRGGGEKAVALVRDAAPAAKRDDSGFSALSGAALPQGCCHRAARFQELADIGNRGHLVEQTLTGMG